MTRSNSIVTLPKSSCTGCKMCGDVCPKHCISFSVDSEGFFYPLVNEDLCIDCGACKKRCPALNVCLNDKAENAYSAYATDGNVKDSGSSGGVFFLLATCVLNADGVVYGAAFNPDLKLRHKRISRKEDLLPLCKSKYLQSDCSSIFSRVKDDLQAGLIVLFAGTPCQVQALRNYLAGKNDDKLLSVDFVCHGVPNQKLFDENLVWNGKRYGKVKSIEFRNKEKKVLHPQTLKMVYEKDGKEKSILRMHYQDPFYFGFQKHISLRPSCYQCQWAKPERCSDITLADFWGIEKAQLGLDSKKGVSCILLNTEKGHKAFAQIQRDLSGVHSLPIDFAIEHNGCLGSATKKPKSRDTFFEDWNIKGYDAVVDKYLVSKRKWVFDLYYAIPTPIRKFVRKLMDKRMKYE